MRDAGSWAAAEYELVDAPIAPPTPAGVEVGVGEVRLHRMRVVEDPRGALTVGEFGPEIPFRPQRYFIVFDVPSAEARGEHAHRRCHQFLICVRGSCAVIVDDGRRRREIVLDHLSLGLHLPPMTWGVQYRYTAEAALLVFCSDHYDARDYIRDYGEFAALATA